MGGSAPRDGRLDLDDLGEVIEHADLLDPAPGGDRLEGRDALTWRERLDTAGVTPWLRRRRGPLAAAAVVVVLAGGAWTLRERSLPPPVDPEIRAVVRDAVPDGSLRYDESAGVVAASVVVTPSSPGEVVTVRGLAGPGIRASAAAAAAADDRGTTVDVTVATGCDDPRSLEPSPDAYRLLVTRTDRYGRSTDGALPVPDTISGQLVQATSSECFQQLLAEGVGATRVVVHPADPLRALHLDVVLRNTSRKDLAIFGIFSIGATVGTRNEPVELAAGSTATVPVTAVVLDCTRPHLEQVATLVSWEPRTFRQVDGISLYASPVDSVSGTGGEIAVAWTAAQQHEVQRELDRTCAGAPSATATVLGAAPAPPDVAAAFGFGTGNDGVALRLRVAVATAGTHVTVTDGTLLPGDVASGPGQLTTASADVVDGRALLTVDWAAPCSGANNPPPAQLTVTAHGTTYPVRVVLAQQVLAHAYAAACPQLSTDELQGSGWPPPS